MKNIVKLEPVPQSIRLEMSLGSSTDSRTVTLLSVCASAVHVDGKVSRILNNLSGSTIILRENIRSKVLKDFNIDDFMSIYNIKNEVAEVDVINLLEIQRFVSFNSHGFEKDSDGKLYLTIEDFWNKLTIKK